MLSKTERREGERGLYTISYGDDAAQVELETKSNTVFGTIGSVIPANNTPTYIAQCNLKFKLTQVDEPEIRDSFPNREAAIDWLVNHAEQYLKQHQVN